MNRIITSLIAILAIAGVRGAEQPGDIPKLVVNITIDKLRGDYLQYFNYSFGERGFKRLLNDGLVFNHYLYHIRSVAPSCQYNCPSTMPLTRKLKNVRNNVSSFIFLKTAHLAFKYYKNNKLPIMGLMRLK